MYRLRLTFPASGRWRLTARAGGMTSRLGTVLRRAGAARLHRADVHRARARRDVAARREQSRPAPARRSGDREGDGAGARHDAPVRGRQGALRRPLRLDREPRRAHRPGRRPHDGRRRGHRRRPARGLAGRRRLLRHCHPGLPARRQARALRSGSQAPVSRAAAGTAGPRSTPSLSAPHGLALAADGALLVSDAGNGRIRRIDPVSGVISTLAQLGRPDGLDVLADGSLVVVDGQADRVVHLAPSGTRIGLVGPVFTIGVRRRGGTRRRDLRPRGRPGRTNPPRRRRRHRHDRLPPLATLSASSSSRRSSFTCGSTASAGRIGSQRLKSR